MKDFKDFFNLIRWKNILIIFLGLLLVRMSIINPFYHVFHIYSLISLPSYMLFVFGTLLIVAAANIINDYFDYDIDVINRDEDKVYIGKLMKKETALKLFYIFSIVGVVIHFLVGYFNGCIQLGAISIVFVAMGYFYSLKYKRQFISGNIVIAFLYSMIIFLPAIFELFCLTKNLSLFKVLVPDIKSASIIFIFFTCFTFLLTLMRDIVKDMKNEIGDRDCGCQTIIIKIGEKRTKNLLYILSIALIFGTIWFVYHYFEFFGIIYAIIIALIIVLPLIYFMKELRKAIAQQDYDFLVQLLGMIFISLLFTISFSKNIFINVLNGIPA